MLSVWLAVAIGASACNKTDSSAESDEAPKHKKTEKPQPESATTSSAPHEKLKSLDRRTPVPLLPRMAHHQKQNMRDHLKAVQNVIKGVAAEDFEAIRSAAEPIGSSPEMRQMCRHMGAGAKGFTDRALTFHEKADGIIKSAKQEDMDGVVKSLGDTLDTCNSCHAQYKQQVVTPKVWQQETGMAPPSAPGGGHH
jgi:cytochrome c556